MKELTNDAKENKIEIVEEKQQRKEIKLIGRQRKINGLILWQFNTKTKELKEAEFKKEDVQIKSLTKTANSIQKHSKVVVKDDCIYFQALNRKNALKKLMS